MADTPIQEPQAHKFAASLGKGEVVETMPPIPFGHDITRPQEW